MSGRLSAALVAFLAVVVFLPSLSGAFLYDDSRSIVENRAIRDLGAVGTVLRAEPARPLLSLSWAVNYALSGLRPWSYHLVNILVHAANAALLASLFLWMNRRLGRPDPAERALFGAALFAVTPMAVETVAYVSSRSTALSALFVLLALRVAAPALVDGRRGPLLAAFGLFVLGLLVKEEAACLPLLLLLLDYVFVAKQDGADLRRRLSRHLPFLLLPVVALAARRVATGAWLPSPAIPTALYAFTQLTQLPGYLLRALVPFDPAFYRGIAPARWPPGLVDAGLAAIGIALVAVALVRRRHWPGAFFAVLWFVAALAPSSTVVALKEMVVDHRAYLAGAAVLYAASVALWSPGRLLFAVALLSALTARTVQYERLIGNPVAAWEDAVERAPASVEARQGLAEAYLAVRDPRASSILIQATALAPGDPRVFTNLGAVLLEEQKPEEAVVAFERAVALAPNDARLRDNLGAVLETLGRPDDAMTQYEAARAGVPALAQPRIRLAELALRRGDADRARALIDEALRLEIDEQETREIQDLQRRLPVTDAVAIVLNHNGRGFVLEAVESLVAQDLAGLEVLVVDNASTDGSLEEVEASFGSRVRVVRNARNLGWGAGNNVGIRATRSRHVILVNNDAVAAPGFARALVEAADADPAVGMVAAKVLNHAHRDVLDTAGHLLHRDGLNRGRGRLEVDRGQYDACRDALFPSGAAGLYRREMLEAIGLFEEAFFLYGDDAELGLRARLCGWGCALAPRAVAYHHYSRSVGAHSAQKAFHVERNRLWLAVGLLPAPLLLMNPFYTAVRLAFHAAAALSGRGAAGRLAGNESMATLAVVTLRAWGSALRGLPRRLARRREVRGLRGFDARRVYGLLRAFPLSSREAAFKE